MRLGRLQVAMTDATSLGFLASLEDLEAQHKALDKALKDAEKRRSALESRLAKVRPCAYTEPAASIADLLRRKERTTKIEQRRWSTRMPVMLSHALLSPSMRPSMLKLLA